MTPQLDSTWTTSLKPTSPSPFKSVGHGTGTLDGSGIAAGQPFVVVGHHHHHGPSPIGGVAGQGHGDHRRGAFWSFNKSGIDMVCPFASSKMDSPESTPPRARPSISIVAINSTWPELVAANDKPTRPLPPPRHYPTTPLGDPRQHGCEAGFSNIVEWVVGVPPENRIPKANIMANTSESLCAVPDQAARQRTAPKCPRSHRGGSRIGVLQGLQIKTCLLVHVPQLWDHEVSLGGAVTLTTWWRRLGPSGIGSTQNQSTRSGPMPVGNMAGHATERVVGDF